MVFLCRNYVSGWPGFFRLFDGTLALGIEVFQEMRAVMREVRERGEQGGLFIIIVVALGPGDGGIGRVLTIPGSGILIGRENPLLGVGAPVAKGFVEPAN